jgi:ABC-2 type transport system ATP-binding protein
MNVIQLANVKKSYGNFVAVDAISLNISSGKIFGLLGPNGAGKTSTMRMLNAITFPDSGTIKLFGESLATHHQNRIGYMPEERGLYRKLTVRAQLEYLGSLRGVSSIALKKSIDMWLERFELNSWAKKKTGELSKGMQQKLQFITTMLHDPELLILDEPVSGLDPINAELINEIIFEQRNAGKTILLSSHRMEQIEQICDEIAMIDRGKIILTGSIRDIKKNSGKHMVRVVYEGAGDMNVLLAKYPIRIADKMPSEVIFELLSGADPQIILRDLVGATNIIHWEMIEPPLKEIFLEAVENNTIQQ